MALALSIKSQELCIRSILILQWIFLLRQSTWSQIQWSSREHHLLLQVLCPVLTVWLLVGGFWHHRHLRSCVNTPSQLFYLELNRPPRPGSAVGGTVAFAWDLRQTLFDVGVVVTLPTNVGEESAWLSKTWLTIWTGYKIMYQFVALVTLGLCGWTISSPTWVLEVALSTNPGAWLWLWIVHGPRIWLATSLCDNPNLSRLWFSQLTLRRFSQR